MSSASELMWDQAQFLEQTSGGRPVDVGVEKSAHASTLSRVVVLTLEYRGDSGKKFVGVPGKRSGQVVLDGAEGEPTRQLILPDVWKVVHDGPIQDEIVDVHARHVGQQGVCFAQELVESAAPAAPANHP